MTDWAERAVERVERGEAVVGVLGLGYVGLPLSLAFAGRFRVVGYDVSARVVANLADGRSHVDDVNDQEVKAALHRFTPTTDATRLCECDFLILAVPTPLTKAGEPDLGPVTSAGQTVRQQLREGQVVILESTTYPGTTREVLQPILEESGLVAGRDFGLAYSPERVDPGNTSYTIQTTPKIVGGIDAPSTRAAASLYGSIVEAMVVEVSSPAAAEAAKIFENVFRDVNIALVNEFALVCERLGLNVWEVLDAAGTKPFGFMRFNPGPGVGGHCIPLDPSYLSYRARRADMVPKFIELSGEVNEFMKYHVVNLVERGLTQQGKRLAGAKVAVMGLAYKRNVSDTRESPAVKIIDELVRSRAQVRVFDPHAPEIRCATGTHTSTPDIEVALQDADAAVFITDHDEFRMMDPATVQAHLTDRAVVVDCRNLFSASAFTKAKYLAIGKPI